MYEVCHKGTNEAKSALAEVLGAHPAAVEPLLNLLVETQATLDEFVDLVGRTCLESVLRLSAVELAGDDRVKRSSLLRHFRRHGCHLKREGRSHSLWANPQTGETEAVPRHAEIPDNLTHRICRGLSVPEHGK